MRLTKATAHKRSLEGWETRRRSGNTRILKRGSNHVWVRPNKERVKLTGFKDPQIRAMRPALESADHLLKPEVKLHAKISNKRRFRNKRVGAETNPRIIRRSTIKVNSAAFNPRSHWQPSGLLAHEIGHVLGPQPKHYYQAKRDFQWKKERQPTRRSPIRRAKTRQSVSLHEDFAETYRGLTHLPMSKKSYHGYWNVHTNQKRLSHMKRYYING